MPKLRCRIPDLGDSVAEEPEAAEEVEPEETENADETMDNSMNQYISEVYAEEVEE